MDGIHPPHATVDAIADCYLHALPKASLNGRIHLLGHSIGGWVVFEMACRLRAMGRDLGSLIIVDIFPAPLYMALVNDPKLDDASNQCAQEKSIALWRHWAPDLRPFRAPGNHLTTL